MMRARELAALALALVLGGCGVVRPIGQPAARRFSVDWAVPIYSIAHFAYLPQEVGRPLFIKGAGRSGHGLLVVPSKDRHIRGLDALDGHVVWTARTRGPNVAQPVAIGDDVLCGSTDGDLYRLRQRNGMPRWVIGPVAAGPILSAPAISKGRIFVTTGDDRLTALRLSDGSTLWYKERESPSSLTITGQAGALAYGDRVITGFSDGTLAAYAQKDGATLWTVDLSGKSKQFIDVDTTPTRVGRLVIAAGYQTGLYAVDGESGSIVWRLAGEGFRTPAVQGNILYVPEATGTLWAVRADSGKVIWRLALSDGVPRLPAVTRKYLLLPVGRSLLLVQRASGRALVRYASFHGFTATPEVAWGTVYAQANSGMVFALGIY